ncbi:NAD(P)H-dependent oxidoreductase [Bacillus mojavensis]|uniref:NAD(P)H-dependent oxidoreductase n=1 Tax=Bacillus subtilis group TaxID=653685 RepID=UPI0004A584A1|nr:MULTISPECIES: NAD(P)H-dependent oxidoreductase [Bacillus subtilis group]MDZ5721852.1 NAD(P)H-dependent oxidoreductase [Bacillus sp. SXabc123]ARV47250.1 flavodoxin [Bacillus subtilis]MBU8707425.1 NAD(P)H-dependent oxidoreductase [Bacillus subtilis]MBU8750520.1 NAD(P)H-dependent oxidoreductase [Bacillus subtilis]MBY0181995.1 NAD(P)H-dependent oxidoreductase [Bacillus subtilis]
MKNILVINAHEYHEMAKGQLNQTLTERMVDKLSPFYNVKTTIVEKNYDIKEEQEKFKWADIIIIQTPVYWYNYPAAFKKYIDTVYEHGVFYRGTDTYGAGGLLEGRQYMLSVTWGAGEEVFNNPIDQPFFEGKGVDEVLIAMHKTQQFIGLKPLKTLSNHSALQPDIEKILEYTDKHLEEVFSLS